MDVVQAEFTNASAEARLRQDSPRNPWATGSDMIASGNASVVCPFRDVVRGDMDASTQGSEYRTNLDRKRNVVLHDFAPSIPEIDIDTFVKVISTASSTWGSFSVY
ncbi:hypothetical protein AX15_005860 [Amanita polypyramis BW_CC]|nr:hypothetical protein AX15_005860 [Amanita polypyramis BW_CC]